MRVDSGKLQGKDKDPGKGTVRRSGKLSGMVENAKGGSALAGDLGWALLLCTITAILIIPATKAGFMALTTAHPFLMGFAKFAVMASMGELLATRILTRKWTITGATLPKMVVWGFIGMLITLMFSIFSNGVAGAMQAGLLPGDPAAAGAGMRLYKAFLISAIMNLTFAPVFMAAHRITDTMIDSRVEGKPAGLSDAVGHIDWQGFLRFVVARTVPFFWIPAHTLTFFLPAEYRVIMAAYLSIALGILLAYARKRKGSAGKA